MANPTWFDAKVYMANKLAQLQATDPTGAWTEDKLTKAMEENGYKGAEGAFKHFNDFGMDENVSPNALFNVNEYLVAKAKQMNALNIEGKTWDAASVYDAIKGNGMNVWEHYDMFGSKEGVNPSNGFNAEGYIAAKTVLMNSTKEGGRADWSIAEVKAALAENGLSALEHYNLFGQAEFKAADKEAALKAAIEVKVENQVTVDDTFDPFSGVKTYAYLSDALAAQKGGSLADKYAITDFDAKSVDVTVDQQAGMAALIAGATKSPTGTPAYHLVDTVAALAGASTTVLTGSTDKDGKANYDISDSLANAAAGADSLVNGADNAFAKIDFAVKADDTAVVNTVKYADIKGNLVTADVAGLTLTHADKAVEGGWTNKGDAIVSVDATGVKDLKTVDMGTFFKDADTLNASNIYLKYIASSNEAITGTDGKDYIVAGAGGNTITGGAGADMITLGAGADKVVLGNVTAAGIDTVNGFTAGTDELYFTGTQATVATKSAASFIKGTDSGQFADINAVLATFATGATNASELGANKAVSFEFDGAVYVVIGDATNAGYAAGDDAVVKLAGITLTADGIDLNGAVANS